MEFPLFQRKHIAPETTLQLKIPNSPSHCPDGALYVNDNSALGNFSVRRGYDRYGSVAYFSAEYKLIGIFTCFDNKYIAIPDSLRQEIHEHDEEDDTLEKEEYSEWRHAQWVWRVSGLALGTVVDQ